ncbi:hypothetical protein [Rhodopseudomonas palustris]|uniref:Uncharacterized protein n=1 Tax=Rhodopseudomonas palustris (strain BisB18) TaxID=316056 RepID=Q216P7_RHOPB
MKSISALLVAASLLSASAALADSRVFIVPNHSDGYGIDQCLAKGEKCGASAAQSYCQSRDFAAATSYRQIEADEITGTVPASVGNSCAHGACNEFLAITCTR